MKSMKKRWENDKIMVRLVCNKKYFWKRCVLTLDLDVTTVNPVQREGGRQFWVRPQKEEFWQIVLMHEVQFVAHCKLLFLLRNNRLSPFVFNSYLGAVIKTIKKDTTTTTLLSLTHTPTHTITHAQTHAHTDTLHKTPYPKYSPGKEHQPVLWSW